ncbi:MAG: tyrosine-protein phosphatase [Turicibacter sp.]|nr:tyrosine-protein phosphatase [Turicibacter sp.]
MDLTNFRDLGGMTGHGGRKIKEKMILRAGQPVGLSEGDKEELSTVYKLAHIVDFRAESEVTKQPVDELASVAYLNIDILASHMKKQKNAPTLDDMIKNLKPGVSDQYMSDVYVDLVMSEDAIIGYRGFIEALLTAKGALLFNCFAGKDRTGWGAAIALKLLGVSDEDIMIDYLASIEGRRAENEKMIEGYRAKGLTEEQLTAFEEMMSVKPLYLNVALETVENEYGSFDHYLKTALKVTDAEIEKLRELYLAA